MNDHADAFRALLGAIQPDRVVGTIIVGGRPLARLEIDDLNNGLPTFTMVTACGRCNAELTRDVVDVREYGARQEALLEAQRDAASSHYQERHP